MGKLGKARKRQRLESNLLAGCAAIDASESGSDGETSASQPVKAPRRSSDDMPAAITVLNLLGQRLDLYFAPTCKALRIALSPLISLQRGAHHEPPEPAPVPSDEAARALLDGPCTQALLRFATRMSSGELIYSDAAYKPFRRALHPLVLAQMRKEKGEVNASSGGIAAQAQAGAVSAPSLTALAPVADESHSLSGRISLAFRHRDWCRALTLLREMALGARQGERPKLGAIQRWVRDCDLATQVGDAGISPGQGGVDGAAAAGEGGVLPASAGLGYTSGSGGEPLAKDGYNTALLLLDAVMRAGGETLMAAKQSQGAPAMHGPGPQGAGSSTLLGLAQRATLTRHPLFTVLPSHTCAATGAAGTGGGSPEAVLSACASSLPPSWSLAHVRQGVRVISHVPGPERRPPSSDDLNVYMTSPRSILFNDAQSPPPTRHDVPGVPGAFLLSHVLSPCEYAQLVHTAEGIGYTRDGIDGIGALVWLADASLLDPIFTRVQALLPQTIAGCAVKGINARWRLFRYSPGAVYRPHIDGAWPGSGLDEHGKLTDDAFPGKRISRLTFLVYLNGGFPGGATTFFLASPQGPGHIDARGVEPAAGSILCFPHGDSVGSLVHEGSAVQEGGVKYIIRTDVLYATEPE